MRNIRKLVYTNLLKYFLLMYSNLNKPQINFCMSSAKMYFSLLGYLGKLFETEYTFQG